MKTKFHIISGGVTYNVAPTDIKNWDEIEFTLERKDYSGVMRSFSSEFQFVGAAFSMLRDMYLSNGFLADAEIAVSTKNNDWTYTEQFRCPLDFSTLQIENEVLTINAVDNSLAAKIKSMKGQKWQFSVDSFDTETVTIPRIELANSVRYNFPLSDNDDGYVNVRIDQDHSTVISTEYLEPRDESDGYDGTSVNRFFMKVNKSGATLQIKVQGYVRCWLSPLHYNLAPTASVPVAKLQYGYWDEDLSAFHLWYNLCDDDVTKKIINGSTYNMWIGGYNHVNYATLQHLIQAAPSGLYDGMFGVVGSYAYGDGNYWTGNHVYEYYGGDWHDKGVASTYHQDRFVNASSTLSDITTTQYPMLMLTDNMKFMGGIMTALWSDPSREDIDVDAVPPLQVIERVVENISPGSTVSIDDDAAGLLEDTYLLAAEALRLIPGAQIYTTFQQFADWMEAVFGYTYRVVGNEVQFVHRSDVFVTSDVKVIEHVRDVKYGVNDSLIYTEVDAGYSKKEYGEIDGRLETNFTNYYATDYKATDKKLSLISKYRADSYGIEFTARKGENETQDDKSDEDVFFIFTVEDDGELVYSPSGQSNYAPSVCVANNVGFIAAMGNGKAVTLTMTSSDGNNVLANISIPAGTALFSAGRLDFTTDDMLLPADWDGLISIDHEGYRYRGFISKCSARYGRENGMDYELIVKDITEL